MRSLSKPIVDIVGDDRLMNNDIAGFMETQINQSDSTCKIIETLNLSLVLNLILITMKIKF